VVVRFHTHSHTHTHTHTHTHARARARAKHPPRTHCQSHTPFTPLYFPCTRLPHPVHFVHVISQVSLRPTRSFMDSLVSFPPGRSTVCSLHPPTHKHIHTRVHNTPLPQVAVATVCTARRRPRIVFVIVFVSRAHWPSVCNDRSNDRATRDDRTRRPSA
jgi:hypothetical protein